VVPGLLGPEEIAGAQCVSVPQPDGTSRCVAIGPDGTLRSVAFGHDGDVRRLDDTALGAPLAIGTTLCTQARKPDVDAQGRTASITPDRGHLARHLIVRRRPHRRP
jgi:hypothetical protein